jgi:hypothetical protein
MAFHFSVIVVLTGVESVVVRRLCCQAVFANSAAGRTENWKATLF